MFVPDRFRQKIVLVAVAVNVMAVLVGSSAVSPGVWEGTRFMIANRRLSYDEKMALKYPANYPAIRFIAAHTSPESSVLLPPSLNEGAVTFYLLYPRGVDSHRDEFLWGRTPRGTYAYVEGAWPSSVTPDVRASSELVVAEGQMLLIRRVKDPEEKQTQ